VRRSERHERGSKVAERQGWGQDFAELRSRLDRAREASYHLANWVRAQSGPAELPADIVTLVEEISKVRSLVSRLADRLHGDPLGLLLHGHPMSREACYLLVASDVLSLEGSYTVIHTPISRCFGTRTTRDGATSASMKSRPVVRLGYTLGCGRKRYCGNGFVLNNETSSPAICRKWPRDSSVSPNRRCTGRRSARACEPPPRVIDHVRGIADEYHLDLGRVAVVRHSAGGYLAIWTAARPRLTNVSEL
jgi:hypothetical protein